MATHRVTVVVPGDFNVLGLGIAIEVFGRRPEWAADWYDVRVCTPHPERIRAEGGLFSAVLRHGLEAVDWADTVIVPQSSNRYRPAEDEVLRALRRAYDRGARLVSFCSGAFVLAAAGVLEGRRVATHWKCSQRLEQAYPGVRVDADVLFVDEGQVLTSGGSTAAIDLCLHIVRRDHGPAVALELSQHLVAALHRAGGQAQFAAERVARPQAQPPGVTRAMGTPSLTWTRT